MTMAEKIILKGRKVVGGVAEGEAIVSRGPTMGWGNFDPRRGIITERGHELEGVKLKGKVFVFPTPRGSGGWFYFGMTSVYGSNPVAMVYKKGNALTVHGALALGKPTVTDLDRDPTEVIETGDWVKVDADKGIVEVTKKSK